MFVSKRKIFLCLIVTNTLAQVTVQFHCFDYKAGMKIRRLVRVNGDNFTISSSFSN